MRRNPLENTGDRVESDVLESQQTPESAQGIITGRRAFVVSALATLTLAAASIPIIEQEAEAQAPTKTPSKKPRIYDALKTKVRKELDGGTTGPIAGILRIDNPRLYYEHDVKGKIEDKNGLNIPTPSMVFEAAKHCWQAAKRQVKLAGDRNISLLKLDQAAQPGVPNQKRLEHIHYNNKLVNDKMLHYWSIIAAEAGAVMKTVQGIVINEHSAAKAKKKPAAANTNVYPGNYVPMGPKDAKLTKKHEKAKWFQDYSDIELELIPEPYRCDKVYLDENKPSSLIEMESAKTLKVLVDLHLEAAVQRRHRYSALQAWMLRHPKSAAAVRKYDGSSHNGKILTGWAELVRDKSNGQTKTGPLLTLLKHIKSVIKLQSKDGAALHRCKN